MAALKERITQDMKEAMKERDILKVSTLRLLLAEIKNKEIDKKGELTDEEILSLIQKAVKQREESIEQYRKGNRSDLVEKETKEIEILKSYLPEPLSEEELDRIIEETIKEVGAMGPKDMGKVMKAIMPKVKGRVDGKIVNERVSIKLQNI